MLQHEPLPLPLLIRTDDRPGESLLSMLVRAAEANVMGRLARLLSLAHVENVRLEYLPFTQVESATSIAVLLGVNSTAVTSRMHRSLPGDQEEVDWYGTNLPRRWISNQIRFAPDGLKAHGHHKDVWSIKPLRFDPNTGEILREMCPSCERKGLWQVVREVTRCPRCKADLTNCETSYLDLKLRSQALELALLVSHDGADREEFLRTLPKPFRDWSAGDVFQAVVEFGLIVSSPVAPPGCSRMKRLSAGDFSFYTTEELVAGYDFVKGWPASFDELLGKLANGRSLAAWNTLGRISKFAPASAPQSALCKLIKGRIDHLRSNSNPATELRRERSLLTASEASEALKIDKPILRRLVPESECVVIQMGGAKLFRRDSLEAAVVAWRTSMTGGEVAVTLGVPEPFVPYLADAGMIEPLSNADALRLARGQVRYDPNSVAGLAQQLADRSKQPISAPELVGLPDVMTGILSPTPWIAVIQAICDGSVEGHRYEHAASALDIFVSAEDPNLARIRSASAEIPDLAVSYLVAEKLTGIDDIVIGGAVKSGLIQGRTEGRNVRVPLTELGRFKTEYALAKDGARELGIPPVYFAEEMRSRGYKPAGKAHHCVVWRRADVKRAVAESLS